MDYKSVITITIALAMLCNHGVSTRGLSGMNETEFMAESKSINRHATIKSIKMRPSYLERTSTEDSISTESSLPSNIAKMFGLGKGCPKGTVPIRRKVVKEGITRPINAVSYKFGKNQSMNYDDDEINDSGSGTGHDYAGIVIRPYAGKRFEGAAAGLNIYQPSPVVSGQFSGALIEVFAGDIGNIAYIHTGWMEETDGEISGCFDTECPGFVQVDTNLPVGAAFSNVSKINGEQFVRDMSLTMDLFGNWWVEVFGGSGVVGYYPSELFSRLQEGAEAAFWGGFVYSSLDWSPGMGTGEAYNGGDRGHQACFMRQVKVVRQEDDDGEYSDPGDSPVSVQVSRCYLAGDNYYTNKAGWDYVFYFGGEGDNPVIGLALAIQPKNRCLVCKNQMQSDQKTKTMKSFCWRGQGKSPTAVVDTFSLLLPYFRVHHCLIFSFLTSNHTSGILRTAQRLHILIRKGETRIAVALNIATPVGTVAVQATDTMMTWIIQILPYLRPIRTGINAFKLVILCHRNFFKMDIGRVSMICLFPLLFLFHVYPEPMYTFSSKRAFIATNLKTDEQLANDEGYKLKGHKVLVCTVIVVKSNREAIAEEVFKQPRKCVHCPAPPVPLQPPAPTDFAPPTIPEISPPPVPPSPRRSRIPPPAPCLHYRLISRRCPNQACPPPIRLCPEEPCPPIRRCPPLLTKRGRVYVLPPPEG
ncbi:hypothetical protein COLO4_22434 [Corchorus olitorius]|uniref:Neprosin PEP catalytic domain-containing protein n=1 Tax=Corchorus olitorius TaxID=93759 RepID=A0A1R3ILU7_9ROSI|nr:hypothetical protein COLO4_22434 [Corchorus olitorius]